MEDGIERNARAIRARLSTGETVLFLGDHTTSREPGYVDVVASVANRFHPDLALNLVSAGSPGQTAAGLGSAPLLALLASSRPDWLAIGIGLTDALRDPALPAVLASYAAPAGLQGGADPEIAPPSAAESYAHAAATSPPEQFDWPGLESFAGKLSAAFDALQQAGVRCAVATTVLLGTDPSHPANLALRAYSRAIRAAAAAHDMVLVDHERAYRSMLDRAFAYKQSVALADLAGNVNHQGAVLLARTFLDSFGVLPEVGRGRLR